MKWRRATIARITAKTVLALCLFLAATAGTFFTSSSSANAAAFDFLKIISSMTAATERVVFGLVI